MGSTFTPVETRSRSIVSPRLRTQEFPYRMTAADSTVAPTLVSLDDVRNAAAALRGVAVRTPLLPSEALNDRVGVPVFLKPEMLQRGGAFKFRGAYWFVSRLTQAERERGLVAPSSGNH